MCELFDIVICSYGGIRGNLRNFGGNTDIVEFSITLVDKFADMAAVKCNMESSLAHTNDVGRMAVMLGPRILALHVIIDVEDVSGELRAFRTHHGRCFCCCGTTRVSLFYYIRCFTESSCDTMPGRLALLCVRTSDIVSKRGACLVLPLIWGARSVNELPIFFGYSKNELLVCQFMHR
jgi:hypothetical protein